MTASEKMGKDAGAGADSWAAVARGVGPEMKNCTGCAGTGTGHGWARRAACQGLQRRGCVGHAPVESLSFREMALMKVM